MTGAVAADGLNKAACLIPAALARGGNRRAPIGWPPGWPPRSAYLHIPFCHRRCFYCDFPVVPLGDRASAEAGAPGSASIKAYLQLLQREIAVAPAGPPLSTLYVGGGTPSLLSVEQLRALLEALHCRYGLAPGAELTLELDPASFDQRRLAGYLAAGITRVSLGGQSFSDAVLESLGRRHRRADLLEAASWLQQAQRSGRLQSWSLDLIQGLPGQTLRGWQEQLDQAIALQPPHLSVYDLIVEPGTVFERLEQRGALELPESDLAADLMELTARTLGAAGYGHYEISNYALPGHASRHNRVYWSGAGWWGFGMGATAAPWGVREARPRTREGYATWLEQAERAQPLGDEGLQAVPEAGMPLDERWMVGFRRREGVRIDVPEALRRRWQPFVERGLLIEEGPRWRLRDPEGLALSNAVLRELLAWWEEEGSAVADPPPSP
ncbi:MAG: radical family heme chaperone HemW [Cyanobacteriota bacterium]|jgi:oxygen-independent coproporphyrinogen-3 oxidase